MQPGDESSICANAGAPSPAQTALPISRESTTKVTAVRTAQQFQHFVQYLVADELFFFLASRMFVGKFIFVQCLGLASSETIDPIFDKLNDLQAPPNINWKCESIAPRKQAQQYLEQANREAQRAFDLWACDGPKTFAKVVCPETLCSSK